MELCRRTRARRKSSGSCCRAARSIISIVRTTRPAREAVLRRYEFYKYIGAYSVEGEALEETAVTSGVGVNVGDFIGDQNLAVNLNGVYNGPPAGAVPEASTWSMMLLGFAALGYATFRRVGCRPQGA